MNEDIQYLVFLPPLPGAAVNFQRAISDFVALLGTTGDGVTRQLGFGNNIPVWSDNATIANSIAASFGMALATGVAIHFTVDDHIAWHLRADLWNWYNAAGPGYNPANAANVEWYDWAGTQVNKRRYLTPEGVPDAAPHMCYNSPAVLNAITQIVGGVVGPALLRGIASLQAQNKGYLFSGITVGQELVIDDYSVVPDISTFSQPEPTNQFYLAAQAMAQDGAPHTRVGYNALTRNGYSSGSPPADINQALINVNQQFITFWGQQFVNAGIPASNLYTHVAASPPQDDSNNAPIGVVFNPNDRPGWTTYALGTLAGGFQPLYSALASNGNPAWGGVEANAAASNPPIPWAEYLSWHFDFGAAHVSINVGASDPSVADGLSASAFGAEAMAAYAQFLSGPSGITTLGSSNDILGRLKSVLPPWFGTNTPILDALLSGPSNVFSGIHSLIQYAMAQTRIATATDRWLDLIGRDFFAFDFQRRRQEPDAAYRARILKEILRSRATRAAISNALFDLTGIAPSIFEPARVHDTGALGVLSPSSFALSGFVPGLGGTMADSTLVTGDTTIVTADSSAFPSTFSTFPGAYGSYNYPCQLFITAYRPPGTGIPNVAGYSSLANPTGLGGYGAGAIMYGSPSVISGPVTDADIYATIARTVAAGVTAWTRIRPFTGTAASANLMEWQPVFPDYLDPPFIDIGESSVTIVESSPF
jgi:hypothetical protein